MKSKKEKIKFNNLFFYNSKNTFIPTGTSDLLLSSTFKVIKRNEKILDLGCGIGVVGISLFKMRNIKSILFASDLSKNSIKFCEKNGKKHNIKMVAKQGSIFEPWKGEKFDTIINDISGISEKIAKISSWFKYTSCATGEDGTILTKKVLTKSKEHLNKNGKIIFPILSLSNKKKILKHAKSNFKKVDQIGFKKWPMPKEFYKHKKLLTRLKKNKSIDFEERFGILTFTTEIYQAK